MKSPLSTLLSRTALPVMALALALSGCASDEAQPADEVAPLQRATELLADEDFPAAVEVLSERTHNEPENGQAGLLLSRAHRKSADFDAALAAAEQAKGITPQSGLHRDERRRNVRGCFQPTWIRAPGIALAGACVCSCR